MVEGIGKSDIGSRQLVRNYGLPFYLAFNRWRSARTLLCAGDAAGDNKHGSLNVPNCH